MKKLRARSLADLVANGRRFGNSSLGIKTLNEGISMMPIIFVATTAGVPRKASGAGGH